MKLPKQFDVTVNTILALVVAALCATSFKSFAIGWPLLTIIYTLIDGFRGEWVKPTNEKEPDDNTEEP